ncbi:MAG TPA: glycosyltransferase family 9 protein [Vicinamibacterales bacterium]|nr:glycosyltransferase family 9 protein [Vicinamibacterales bacterium]HPW20188.1 glycosyltransferase family 9 protein [Vicinamibacterales bacterium]
MLQVANPWERRAIAAADAALGAAAWIRRRRQPRPWPPPRRILVFRLERIGDLVMSLPALHALRERAPEAFITLAVGSWNLPLALQIAGLDSIETLDAPWLSRGAASAGWRAMVRRARSWRRHGYDLAINLEGDIRSHLLMALTGAARTAGFGMAGGGPLLDECVPFDPRSHTAINGVRLVSAAFGERAAGEWPVEGREAAAALPRATLRIPPSASSEAARLLADASGTQGGRPLVGLQVGAGRAVKEWPLPRLAEIGAWAHRELGAALVLTGSAADGDAARALRGWLPPDARVADLTGAGDLLSLAAVLSRLALFVTPDTGPMHLAAVMGTPLVAVFGPSSPERWGPLAAACRIVRIDLPCSPCNRIRNPPARCQGHTPDCLEGIAADQVIAAARDLLDARNTEHADGRQ